MKAGGGKQKGSAFERRVCGMLSLWASKGQSRDLYWRSASSGGRATQLDKSRAVRTKIGQGDIVAMDQHAQYFLDLFTVECKFYKSVGLSEVCFGIPRIFEDFWRQAEKSCVGTQPLLVVKENRRDELVFTTREGFDLINSCVRKKKVGRTCSFPYMGAHGFLLREMIVRTKYDQIVSKAQRLAKAIKKEE